MSAACRSCGAPIEWALTEKGRPIPIDILPVPNGNILLKMHRGPGEPGTAHVVTVEERKQYEAELRYRQRDLGHEVGPLTLYMSHFSTCPQSKDWRKKKEKKANG